ncbi:MAG: NAD-dependent epimerase/dehydratase family protein [Bacteroidales bacterium]|nr:MAG: NAD-dependent epimerase/dehydratase family protein [Bacteroidales bacterium]
MSGSQTSDTKESGSINAEIITGNVTERSFVGQAFSGPDIMINLAGINEFWIPPNKDFYRFNIEGTRNVLEEALTANIRKCCMSVQ